MSNIRFPKLSLPRLLPSTFKPLIGNVIPAKSLSHTGAVGNYIDNLIKTSLRSPSSTTVDLALYGVEIKSKDVDTKCNWTIGSMTFADIIQTDYINSAIYQKLQALLLVSCDDKFRTVVNTELVYMDMDEVQVLLEETYEEIRKKMLAKWIAHQQHIYSLIQQQQYNQAVAITFKPFESIKGKYGSFEHTAGTSFNFRITVGDMKYLINIAANTATLDRVSFSFE